MDHEIERGAKKMMQELWASLENERKSSRIIFPGSYDPTDYSLMIHDDLGDAEAQIVFLHEHAHYMIGLCHWGESIRRLDHLEVTVALSLNKLRGSIIAQTFGWSKSNKPDLSAFRKLSEDPSTRAVVRDALASNAAFIDALRLIDDAASRKKAMYAQAIRVDEGNAYWACRHLYSVISKDTPPEAVNALNQELDAQFRTKLPKHLSVAYTQMCEIADFMGNDFSAVYQVPYVCVNPQLGDIDFIGAPFKEFTKKIQAPNLSPDLRFETAIDAVRSGDWRKGTAKAEMYRLCDRLSKKPQMSIDEFNRHWYNSADNHPRVVSIMNRIHEEAGIGITYDPPVPKGGHGATSKPTMPLIEIIETGSSASPPEWGVAQWLQQPSRLPKESTLPDVAKQYQQLAMTRDSLMRTMRMEGLI